MLQLNLHKDRVIRPKSNIENMALWLRGSDGNYTHLYKKVLKVKIMDNTIGVRFKSKGMTLEREHEIHTLHNAQLFRVTHEEKEYLSFRQLGSSQYDCEEI